MNDDIFITLSYHTFDEYSTKWDNLSRNLLKTIYRQYKQQKSTFSTTLYIINYFTLMLNHKITF